MGNQVAQQDEQHDARALRAAARSRPVVGGWLRQLALGLFERPFHGQAAIRRTAAQLRQHALTTVPIIVAASSAFVLVEVHRRA